VVKNRLNKTGLFAKRIRRALKLIPRLSLFIGLGTR
jgi:hypothetical protein